MLSIEPARAFCDALNFDRAPVISRMVLSVTRMNTRADSLHSGLPVSMQQKQVAGLESWAYGPGFRLGPT